MTSRITLKQIEEALANCPPPDMICASQLKEDIERFFKNAGDKKTH